MDAIPPEYDKSTKQRIYRQEWLEYFNYIGWDRAIREHPEHYYAIFPPGSAQGPYGTSTMSGVLTDPLGVHDTPDPVSAAAPILVNQRLTDNVPYGGAILAPPVSVTASAAAKLFLDDGSSSSGSSGSRSFSNTSSSSSSVSSRDERNDAGVSRGHRRHQRDAEGDGGDADDKKTSSRRRHRDSSNTKRRSRHRHRDRSKRRSGHRDRKAGRKRDREHDYEKSGDEKSARHEERSARREERRARGDHHSNGEDGHRHRQRPHRSERGERGRSRDRDRDRDRDKEREREKGRGREKDRNRDRDRDRDRPLPSGGADGHKGHYILKEGSDRWRGKGGNPHGAAADQYDDRKEDARQRRQRDEARRRK